MDITLKDLLGEKTKTQPDLLPTIEKNLSILNSILGNVEKLEKYKHIQEFLSKTKGGAMITGGDKKVVSDGGASSTETYNKLVATLEQINDIKGDGYTAKELLKDIKANKDMVIKAL